MSSALGHDERDTAGTVLSDILAGKTWNTLSASLERDVFTDRGGMRKWLRATSLDQESTLPQQARRRLFTVHVAAQVELPPVLFIQRGDSCRLKALTSPFGILHFEAPVPSFCLLVAFER